MYGMFMAVDFFIFTENIPEYHFVSTMHGGHTSVIFKMLQTELDSASNRF